MKPLISIGPISIYFFGLMIAIGSMIAVFLFLKLAKQKGLNEDLLLNGVTYSFIGGIIGARIVYILIYNPAYYLSHPIEILFISEGGLSIHGGLLGGLLVGYFYLKKHQIPIWQTLDIAAPAIILAQGISRIGCDVFGAPTNLPWGVEVNGQYLHPAQAYEFLLDYLLFGYLWLRLKKPSYEGQVFIHYLIGFMVIRGIVEFTRINPMVFGPFSVSHIMSLIGIIIGFVLIRYRKKQNTPIKDGPSITKKDYIGIIAFVLILMLISLFIYYSIY